MSADKAYALVAVVLSAVSVVVNCLLVWKLHREQSRLDAEADAAWADLGAHVRALPEAERLTYLQLPLNPDDQFDLILTAARPQVGKGTMLQRCASVFGLRVLDHGAESGLGFSLAESAVGQGDEKEPVVERVPEPGDVAKQEPVGGVPSDDLPRGAVGADAVPNQALKDAGGLGHAGNDGVLAEEEGFACRELKHGADAACSAGSIQPETEGAAGDGGVAA